MADLNVCVLRVGVTALVSTYRLGALHVLPQQPVQLQVPLSLVARLQPLFNAHVDVLDCENAKSRVVRRVVVLLLPFGEDGEEHVLLSADVERLRQRPAGFGQVSRLQQTVLLAFVDAPHRKRDVRVELLVAFAEANDARCVKQVAGGAACRHPVLRSLRLDGHEVDEASAGEAVDVINVKVWNKRQCV